MKRARRTPPSLVHKIVARPRYSLADLLLQMPDGAPIDTEWEATQPIGREVEQVMLTLRAVQAMKRFMRQQQRKRAGRGICLRRLIDEGRD
jgi:hypothetical protein